MNMLYLTGSSSTGLIIYVVIFAAIIYFMMYLPQKKEKKRVADLMANMSVGDTVLTTAGFYGTIIDLTDDTAIVEFGNNKNCRIPMQKTAIVQIEKPQTNTTSTTDNTESK